ncbi:MAG: TatD family hydrolase [Alistipes sp.]|nr:TatD family hydrolase [Alistipes sp.]
MIPFVDIHTHLATDAVTILTVGVHPWQAADGKLPSTDEIASAEAVGEIGLDKASGVDFSLQMVQFQAQLRLAEAYRKPVVLHVVRAYEEVLKTLDEVQLPAVIFHGFIGSPELAERLIRRGFYLSFGERTFRSSKTQEALRRVPLARLFIETDESRMPLAEIYEKAAEAKGITCEELQQATYENYLKLFRK